MKYALSHLLPIIALGFFNYLGGEMKVTSSAFENGFPIPKKYTCQGENISFPFEIADFPEGTKSFAIIFEDPDAPSGTFDHWIAWNITPKSEFDENSKFLEEGTNGFGKHGYGGPCPPPGRAHRYYFRVFALNRYVELLPGSKKAQLYQSIKTYVIDEAELMGTYQRQ